MGLFDRNKSVFADLRGMAEALKPDGLGSLTGTADSNLLRNGILARGLVTSLENTGTVVGSDGDPRPVCEFGIQVTLDNSAPYTVVVRQSVPIADVPGYVPGETFVAVRVDPANRMHVCIDRNEAVPTVTVSDRSTGQPSAATVLRAGTPVRAVVVMTQPLNAKNPAGVDLYAFVLTILAEGEPPRQVQLGNPVPANCIPLLYPGSNLPACVMTNDPGLVAIDWEAALVEASK